MTNVPGLGFVLVLYGGASMFLLCLASVVALCVHRLRPAIRFHLLLVGAYLCVGVLAGVGVAAHAWPNAGQLQTQLIAGALSYLVSGAVILGGILGTCTLVVRFVSGRGYESSLVCATLAWSVGFGVPVLLALRTNLLLVLVSPVTGFVSGLIGGPIVAFVSE